MTKLGDASRRDFIYGGGAVAAALSLRSAHAMNASPDLEKAAGKDGLVVFYSAVDLAVSLGIANAFMKKYPKIKVQVERTGAEQLTERVMQEYSSNIKMVDVVDSSDVSGVLDWKERGWLASYLPEEVVRAWPSRERDADNDFATFRASLSVMGRNTAQVPPDKAPDGYEDLLHPQWRERIVKAHPAFSGSVMLSTFVLVKLLGWSYFEKLAKQQVMQVQAAVDAVKNVAQGERSIMLDGSEYDALYLKNTGNPIDVIYPVEGSPLVPALVTVMKAAPHPNAARLFTTYLFSLECQNLISTKYGLRSFHPDIKENPGRRPLSEIKLLHANLVELKAQSQSIKKRYSQIFGV